MVINDNIITNKKENNLGEIYALEELGQVELDEQKKAHLEQLLHQLNINQLNNEETKLLSQRIATKCYENNISYTSIYSLFEELELNINSLEEVYNNYGINQGYLDFAQIIHALKKHGGKRKIDVIESQLFTALQTANMTSYPTAEINTKEEIALIYNDNKVIKTTYKDQDRSQYLTDEQLLDCCPYEVEMIKQYYDPTNVVFNWKINVGNDEPLIFDHNSLNQIANSLNEMGYSYQSNKTRDYLSWCKKALKNYNRTHKGCYSEKVMLIPKGFGYDEHTKKIVVEDYPLLPEDDEKIREALNLINTYIMEFPTEKERKFLANNIKWGLISAFAFARKQLVQSDIDLIPYPFLCGMGNTGKTNGHGKFILNFWYENPSEGLVSGQKIKSVKQFNEQIMLSTLPLVIDEASRFCGRSDRVAESHEELKEAIGKIVIRKVYGKEPKTFVAYNSFMLTANDTLFDSTGGLTRRVFQEDFGGEEIKEEKEKAKFIKKYNLQDNGSNAFSVLRYLGHSFAKYVIREPERLRDWKGCVDKYLKEVSEKYNITLSKYLTGWLNPTVQALEEALNSETEKVKFAFRKVILDAKKYDNRLKDEINPEVFTRVAIEGGVSDFNVIIRANGIEEVHFQKVFIENLFNKKLINRMYTYEDFSRSYGWDYRRDANHRYLSMPYSEFVEWVFPDYFNDE